jgi:hypothetical protein
MMALAYNNDSITGEYIQAIPLSIKETVTKLNELSELSNNWDSYGALSPSKKSFIGAMQLANDLFETNTPTPDIFPVPNGNIQFEWSIYGFDLEIEVAGSNSYLTSFENLNSGDEFDEKFTYDLTKLRTVLGDLTRNNAPSGKLKLKVIR